MSVVSGRDVYAGRGNEKETFGSRVVERDGDETRRRGVDLLVRRENETERSKEKAGRSSVRDEDRSNRGREQNEREKRRQGMRRTRETLVEEGWGRVAEKNVGKRKRGSKEDGE